MRKKNSKRENINLFFSAFLILAYIVCGYFFAQYANAQDNQLIKNIVIAAILVVFGLLVFYATRVGEGTPIKRFSIITLVLVVLPALYIVIAAILSVWPFVEVEKDDVPLIFYMAAVALGYGIPYTFLSGFETVREDEETTEEYEILEGGVEADLEEEDEEEPEEEPADEVVVEGIAAEEESEDDSGEEAETEEPAGEAE